MLVDFCSSSPLQTYKILSNTITPRPIAWISTIFPNGSINLAPFSFFTPVSSNPPIFSLCLMQKSDGSQKDTYKNIIATNKATISLCEISHLSMLDCTASELPFNTSEAVVFDIKLEIAESNYPPMPSGTKVAFMCDLYKELHLGDDKTLLLSAHSAYIDNSVYREDLQFLPTFVARVGRVYKTLGSQIVLNENKATQDKDSKLKETEAHILQHKDLDDKTTHSTPQNNTNIGISYEA